MRIEFAIREWGRREADVAARLKRIDNRRRDDMRRLFSGLGLDDGDVEAGSLTVFSLFIASHCIAADHGERSRADVIAIATQHLVAEG